MLMKRRHLVERFCVEYAAGLKAVIDDELLSHRIAREGRRRDDEDLEEGFQAGMQQAILVIEDFGKIAAEYIIGAVEE